MKYKIAFVCTSISRGGLELYTARLAKSLAQRGHELLLIVQKNSFLEEKLKELIVENGNDNRIHILLVKKRSQYLCFPTAKKISNVLKEEGIDKLVITTPKDVDLGAFAKTLSFNKLKLIYLQQMSIGINKKSWYFDWKFGKLDRWYAPLKWLKDETQTNTNLDISKVRIVPVTIECDDFISYQTTRNQARKMFSLKSDVFYFGFIGRIDVQKEPHRILQAFEKLKREYLPTENIELIIVGDRTSNLGKEKRFADEFEESVKSHKYAHLINRFSFIQNVKAMFRAINIFLMTSRYEAIGLVTQEAMAIGTVVIGSDTGGTPELIDNGKYGYVFKTGDVDDLCQKMYMAYQDRDKHLELIDKAKNFVSSHFDRSICCERIEKDLSTL